MTLMRAIFSILLFASLFSGCSNGQTSSTSHAHDRTPARNLDGPFTLYRLDGDRYPGEPAPEGARLLHGWLVLKACPIESIPTREKIFKAFDDGISASDASATPVDCFNPRHAIRVETDGVTVDYLICFQCSNYVIWEGETQVSGGGTTLSPQATFDAILSACTEVDADAK
jgi:hypothetical protein